MGAVPHDLDLHQLRAFAAVAEAGGFGAAARVLNRTQSAVSTQVRKLEAAVGRRLFERDTRRVDLTDDGVRVLRHARRLLALNDEALAELRETLVEGRVRLGVPDDYAACFLPGPLARFAGAHPRVELEVRCELSVDLMRPLAEGDLDLVLATRQPTVAGGTLLRRESLVWAAARDRDAHAADPLPLALFPRGCAFRDAAFAALAAQGRRYRVAFTSPSLAGLRAAVLGGLGVTVLARSAVTAAERVLGAADGLPPLPPVEIALHRTRRRVGPAVDRLAGFLTEALGEADAAA